MASRPARPPPTGDPWRALQINRLLRADSAVTPEAMRRYQTDPGSVRADLFVPFFLHAAAHAATRGGASARLDTAAKLLAEWDRRYTKENERAVLFERAMRLLGRRTWDELMRPDSSGLVAQPSTAVLLQLLQDSASAWWDDRRTGHRTEDRDAILAASLESAYDIVVAQLQRAMDHPCAPNPDVTSRIAATTHPSFSLIAQLSVSEPGDFSFK